MSLSLDLRKIKENPMFNIPPLMWAEGAFGYLGCHVIKYFVFPSAIVTPWGCVGGMMLACSIAGVLAFMTSYGADLIDKIYSKPAFYGTLAVANPFIAYSLCLTISKCDPFIVGMVALTTIASSIALFTLQKQDWRLSIGISPSASHV